MLLLSGCWHSAGLDNVSKVFTKPSSISNSDEQKQQLLTKAAVPGVTFTAAVDVSSLDQLVQQTWLFPRNSNKLRSHLQQWLQEHPNDVSESVVLFLSYVFVIYSSYGIFMLDSSLLFCINSLNDAIV